MKKLPCSPDWITQTSRAFVLGAPSVESLADGYSLECAWPGDRANFLSCLGVQDDREGFQPAPGELVDFSTEEGGEALPAPALGIGDLSAM